MQSTSVAAARVFHLTAVNFLKTQSPRRFQLEFATSIPAGFPYLLQARTRRRHRPSSPPLKAQHEAKPVIQRASSLLLSCSTQSAVLISPDAVVHREPRSSHPNHLSPTSPTGPIRSPVVSRASSQPSLPLYRAVATETPAATRRRRSISTEPVFDNSLPSPFQTRGDPSLLSPYLLLAALFTLPHRLLQLPSNLSWSLSLVLNVLK
ncbi:hypothetical protein M0R45_025757 [Rubus argutus]|uniref:Uncharacterized protein n=1 Tax=Rubus argutus TaxID=59490 RepID=A0AAW1WXZ2_RUBAR